MIVSSLLASPATTMLAVMVPVTTLLTKGEPVVVPFVQATPLINSAESTGRSDTTPISP
jgi:hypothetical protein